MDKPVVGITTYLTRAGIRQGLGAGGRGARGGHRKGDVGGGGARDPARHLAAIVVKGDQSPDVAAEVAGKGEGPADPR